MIIVHHLNNSRSQRVLWLLEELGDKATAGRYRQEAADYRACIDRAVDGNLQRDRTPPFLSLQLYAKAPVGNDYDQLFIGCLLHLQAHGAQPPDWVLVHDAARCLITPQQIAQLIDACRNDRVGGLLALPLSDTLKVKNPLSARAGTHGSHRNRGVGRPPGHQRPPSCCAGATFSAWSVR